MQKEYNCEWFTKQLDWIPYTVLNTVLLKKMKSHKHLVVMPDAVQKSLRVSKQFNVQKTLKCGCYCYPYFIFNEIKAQILK